MDVNVQQAKTAQLEQKTAETTSTTVAPKFRSTIPDSNFWTNGLVVKISKDRTEDAGTEFVWNC